MRHPPKSQADATGRFPPEEWEDVWDAMMALCRCYARRRQLPPEDLLCEVLGRFLKANNETSSVIKIHETKFLEAFRAYYKQLRRAADVSGGDLRAELGSDRGDRRPTVLADVLHAGALELRSMGPSRCHGDSEDYSKQVADLGGKDAAHGAVSAADGAALDRDDSFGPNPNLRLGHVTETILPEEFTTEEAATFLRVSRSYVLKLVNTGQLPARLVGRYRRIPASDLVAYRDKTAAQARDALVDLSHAARAELAGALSERSGDASPG